MGKLLAAVLLLQLACAAITKPCPACNQPNNPADYPMPNDDGDNPSDMTKKKTQPGGNR